MHTIEEYQERSYNKKSILVSVPWLKNFKVDSRVRLPRLVIKANNLHVNGMTLDKSIISDIYKVKGIIIACLMDSFFFKKKICLFFLEKQIYRGET